MLQTFQRAGTAIPVGVGVEHRGHHLEVDLGGDRLLSTSDASALRIASAAKPSMGGDCIQHIEGRQFTYVRRSSFR